MARPVTFDNHPQPIVESPATSLTLNPSPGGRGEPGRANRHGARWTIRLGGLGIVIVTLALMMATEPWLAIVWDEGFNLGHEERVRDWLRAIRDPSVFARTWRPPSALEELVEPDPRQPPRPQDCNTRAKLFEPAVLEWFWAFAREQPHGHPPFYAWIGQLGDLLSPSKEQLRRARLGTMVAFSMTAGALFVFLARRRGLWAGSAAAGVFVLQPRLFAHGHYTHYDGLLTCLWVGSILAFAKAVEPGDRLSNSPRWRWAVVFGLLSGAAAATKLTGWFLPLPFLAWTVLYRDRRAALTILVGGLVGLATLYAVTPPFWNNPIAGVERFLQANLTRAKTTKIPTMFLGRIIMTPKDSLPWYNTLVWTVFITPVGFLALAMIGVGWSIRVAKSQSFGLLAVASWAFMLTLRAMPHTPGHDAERQFLAAFGCLAPLAGLGAGWVVERFGQWGKAAVVAALAEGAIGIALTMPVPLSYYSPLVGSLPGAARLGMEPTYYWDALTDDALAWLRTNTKPGEKIIFPTTPSIWRYLAQAGKLPPGAMFQVPGRPTWYVVQNRSGALEPADHWLIERIGPKHVLVERRGVPLIWAFPYEERKRAVAEVGEGPAQ